MKSSSADYRFIVKETPRFGGGTWCLECYPQTQQLPFISGVGCMYINLKKDISEEQAKRLADFLNECIDVVTVVDK